MEYLKTPTTRKETSFGKPNCIYPSR